MKRDDPRALRRRIEELEAAIKKGAANAPLIRPEDVRRLEAAIHRMLRFSSALQRRHAQMVDKLSQRMQVVVAEVGWMKAAFAFRITKELEHTRMQDVPRELGRVTAARGRRRRTT